MKMRNLLAIICLIGAAASTVDTYAQTGATGGKTAAPVANETIYLSNEFDGFRFQLPAGIMMEKGSEFKATYPDGSFGISMKKINTAANRKISVELCKRTADSFHIPRTAVTKAAYGKAKGAEVKGRIEGKDVTIIVLPYDDHQLQIVMLADPSREAWAKHFMESLKR